MTANGSPRLRAPTGSPAPRILVVRLRRLGDILRTTPILRALRQALPEARIDAMVGRGFESALADNPYLDEIHVAAPGLRSWWELARHCRRRRYSMVLDVQSSARSLPLVMATGAPLRVGWRKRWTRDWGYTRLIEGWDDAVYFSRSAMRFVEALALPASSDFGLDLTVPEADREWARTVLGPKPERAPFRLILSIVARDPGRRWPDANFVELAAQLLAQAPAQLVLAHAPTEVEEVRSFLSRLPGTHETLRIETSSLARLAAIYAHGDLWIGNDGGPKHVATAVSCPTVTLVRRSDREIAVDGDDPRQIAVAAPAHLPDSLEEISVRQVFDAVVSSPLWQRRPADGAA